MRWHWLRHALSRRCDHQGRGAVSRALIPLGGKRWWEQRLPSFLSIRAGGNLEKVLIGPALTVLTAWLIISAFDGAPEAIYAVFAPMVQ